jgi:hypothetical protein
MAYQQFVPWLPLVPQESQDSLSSNGSYVTARSTLLSPPPSVYSGTSIATRSRSESLSLGSEAFRDQFLPLHPNNSEIECGTVDDLIDRLIKSSSGM